MKKMRLSIGIAAVMAIVSMNLIHAWNNYGITDSRSLMNIKASPAKDTINCETKPGDMVEWDAIEKKESKGYKHCKTTENFIHYTIDENGILIKIGESQVDYRTDNIIPIETMPGYTSADFFGSLTISNGYTEEKFLIEGINCIGVYIDKCCIPQEAISDCPNLLKGTN